MKILKLKYPLLLAALLSLGSCNNYLDINDSPNNIGAEQMTPVVVLPGAITNNYRVQARRLNFITGVFMNSYAGNSYSYGTPLVDEYTPNISDSFYNDIWDDFYRNSANFQAIIDFKDDKAEYVQYKAIAKVMKAYYMGIITDLYGDAPYSEAFKFQNNLAPKYDKGEDIYKASIADIENAIAAFNSGEGLNPSSADVVFQGDATKWVAFANTLKLRFLLRMSKVTGDMGTYRDQKLATLAGAQFLTVDATVNPGYSSKTNAQQNPYTNYFYITSALTRPQNFGMITASENIAIALNGNPTNDTRPYYQKYNGIVDGRRGRMFSLVSGRVEGVRQGATPGQPGAEAGRSVSRIHYGIVMGNLTPTSNQQLVDYSSQKPGVLISLAETKFLLAEAAIRYPSLFSNATTNFNAGITASFSYFGASTTSAAYITAIQAIPGLGIVAGSTENKIEAIMTQKWIALTGVNPEQSYFDYSRTGYPQSPLPTITSRDSRPNRLMYPGSEYATNTNNVPAMSSADAFTKNKLTPFWNRN
jgi:hypothetical protein